MRLNCVDDVEATERRVFAIAVVCRANDAGIEMHGGLQVVPPGEFVVGKRGQLRGWCPFEIVVGWHSVS